MKTVAFTAFAVALLALAVQPAGAATNAIGANIKCPHDEPVVGINETKMLYATQAQMQKATAGKSPTQVQAMMKQYNVKLMCLSQAKAFGATQASAKSGPVIPGGMGNADSGGMYQR